MGSNDRMPDLEGPANEVAVKAGAIRPCDNHSDILINRGDPDADDKAYAIGTNRWKEGDLDCDREQFMDAIELSAESCPQCDKWAEND